MVEDVDDGAAETGATGAPGERRAYATYGGPVDTAGDAAEAARLAEAWSVDNADARALTHGFHAYAGRMHPSTARRLLRAFAPEGGRVLDPFCGGGTVLVEAYAGGRDALGVDASPLAVQLARVRTAPLDAERRAELLLRAERIAERAKTMAFDRTPPRVPPGARGEFDRFEPHVAYELFSLREPLFEEGQPDASTRALRLCLSSILVKCLTREAPLGKGAREAGAAPKPRRIGRGMPSRWFADRARELVDGLAALEAAAPPGTPTPRVEEADARHLEGVGAGTIDFVASSPPYAGVYDYAEEHEVRFTWLGLPRERLERTQWGTRQAAGGADAEAWSTGRARWMAQLARVLKPGARAALVVGDGVVEDAAEDAAEATAAAATRAGLTFVARASQPRPPVHPALARAFQGRVRKEHVVLLAKA